MLPDDKTSVRVAVRVRPLSVRERAEFQKPCLAVSEDESQIIIGTERAFTFDYTFDSNSVQEDVFCETTKDLIDGCFQGLNATILAYGQTGSGKTYTMGTGFDVSIPVENFGIVPRAVDYMFEVMQSRHQEHLDLGRAPPVFDILVQFIELYQDDLVDLLDRATRGSRSKRVKPPRLGEDKNGNVVLHNVSKKPVGSREDILNWLKQGALARTTGSTNMNAQSSRSHAIFTIEIKQAVQQYDEHNCPVEFLTTMAKFHFVDLAGSERLKRTNATGDRQKEGISINCGLLALGNVISKLGDTSIKATHIPYRESKLTRLLQDSLGGNSRTLMIACVSPAEADFVETLNTLRYANRARNIQNKVVFNQDKSGQTISTLRNRILDLERELMEYQQGKRQPGVEAFNDMFVENNAMQKENEELRRRLQLSKEENGVLKGNLEDREYRIAELRAESDRLKEILGRDNNSSPEMLSWNVTDMDKMRIEYAKVIENLETKLRLATKDADRTESSPPRKRSVGSGSKTFRVRPRKLSEEPPETMEYSSIDEHTETVGSVTQGNSAMYFTEAELDEDVVSIVSDIDEQIREKEEKLHEMQQALDAQKVNYEAKIQQLVSRINEVEAERNVFLREVRAKKGGFDPVKAKEREVKFSTDLEELKRQLKEQHEVKNNYKRLQKDFSANEKKVVKLLDDIAVLKRVRCETIRKAELDSKKAREKDLQQARVMSQKEKEFRLLKKQNADLKEKVLQYHNKVVRLSADLKIAKRVHKNGMSDQVAGRLNKPAPNETTLKNNWEEFLRYFRAVSYKRMRLKQFEKQLNTYNEELKQLREVSEQTEKSLVIAQQQHNAVVANSLMNQLEETRSTIHFFEQKNMEIQNETVYCEESTDEYTHLDPAYIQLHFPEEHSSRFFLTNLIEFCMTQQEEFSLLEARAQSTSDEAAILRKDLMLLREILQAYVVDGPGQAKLDVANVARKKLEENGDMELSTDDVLAGILRTSLPSRSAGNRTKARQLTLSGPGDMLIAGKNQASSTPSSTAGSPVTSSDSDRTYSSSSGVAADLSSLSRRTAVPKLLPLKRFAPDSSRSKALSHGPTACPSPVESDCLISSSLSFRSPSRSISLNHIAEHEPTSSRELPSPGHSLENVAAPPASPLPGRIRRYPCRTQLA
ncbi:hypothetical protein RvY_18434 [Ramazzottius varieornatus]|uniref:Kinesin motor domain-containing protein n=1 Tax=Ramazzottius varieornatus TaxID=947166 RepID=A0A1D1W5S8_RAMVA|nr:hypothetical protein RvY_18434 [Ramazzottius varieornatus]